MKKFVIIIMILVAILIGMFFYKNVAIKTNNEITVQEVSLIQTYLTKIYMWKEVTKEALPVFEDINNADDIWVWEVVKKNLEDYELSYEQLQAKAKELFGEGFSKELLKQETKYLLYDEQSKKYYATGMGLDQKEDSFLLNEIKKTKDGYEVEIIEYLDDYTNEQYIILRNTEEKEIGKIDNQNQEESKEIVKKEISQFTKKKIYLKKEDDKIYVQRVTN